MKSFLNASFYFQFVFIVEIHPGIHHKINVVTPVLKGAYLHRNSDNMKLISSINGKDECSLKIMEMKVQNNMIP